MSLQDLINVQISSATVSPTRPGFGTPLVAGYHTRYTDRVRFYPSLAALEGDGFVAKDPIHMAVAAAFAQNPAPQNVAVGRRALPNTQTLQLTLSSTSNTDTYKFTIVGFDGVSHSVSFASTGVVNTDAATLTTTLQGFSNIGTVTNPGAPSAVVQIAQSAASGHLVDIQGWNPSGTTTPIISVADTTSDPGIATDLAAIQAGALPGSWYGLALDSNSAAEVTAAAGWAESAGAYLFIYNNSDTACITTSTSDIFSTQKTLAHARSGGLYANSQLLCYSGLAWLAKTLPMTPGSLTFMYKTLASVPADVLSETAQINLNGKKANYYQTLASINTTINGWSASGEFFDITWGTDALTAQIQIDLFATLAGAPKIPYTDLGVDVLKNVVQGDLNLFADNQHNFLAKTPAPTVSAPTVASVPQATRAARIWPVISFSGKLAGAIHSLTVNGSIQA